jgi:hypothetical protein
MLRRVLIVTGCGVAVCLFVVGGSFLLAWREAVTPPIRSEKVPSLVAQPSAPTPPRKWTFNEIEQELERLRAERKERPAAADDLSATYATLATPKFSNSADYPEHCVVLAKWRDQHPDSPTPLLALAKAHINWAWEARGVGFADTVTDEGWQHFHTRIAEAKRLVDAALELGVKDGEAYALLILIAKAEGRPQEQARAWLKEGQKLDPTYYMMYIQMADYLLPKWHGENGEVERFAAEVVEQLPGDDGLDVYGHIAWSINAADCTGSNTLFFGEYDPKVLVQAAEVLAKRHPETKKLTHFAALCTVAAQDHAAARRIRPLVEDYYEDAAIWPWQGAHSDFLLWCQAEEVPAEEESWIWTSHYPHGGIAFTENPRYIWCGHEFHLPATLLDVKNRRVRVRLDAPGACIRELSVDSDKKWVLASAWRPAPMLMLWDLTAREPGKRIDATSPCTAVAIHPRKEQIAWSDGLTVMLFDESSGKQHFEIKSPQEVFALRFSPEGDLLAAGSQRWIVCDVAEGKIKYELPHREMQPRPSAYCENILAFDGEGRAWAVAIAAESSPSAAAKRSLVRYSADGKTWDTLIEGISGAKSCLSSDRRLLAVAKGTRYGKESEGLEVLDVEAKTKLKDFSGHWCRIESLAFSRDNKKLASIGDCSGVLKIWSLEETTVARK